MEKDFTEREFDTKYQEIKNIITAGKYPEEHRKTVFVLGGQPGSGKSSFYSNSNLENYIPINGDDYRKFHPKLEYFEHTDVDEYVARTQYFVNKVSNRLISELSREGYNLIIEGTLRTAEIPIKTCNLLKDRQYESNLVVIACSAEEAWKSTIERANLMKKKGEVPRLVPIDKYNETVQCIARNIQYIKEDGCFDSIRIIDRDGKNLYDMSDAVEPWQILSDKLKLGEWNQHLEQHKQEYIRAKISLLQQELDKYER